MRLKAYIISIPCAVILLIILIFWIASANVKFYVLSTYQFYHLLLLTISSFITLSAVLVALFKDYIISAFKYPRPKILPRDTKFIYENLKQKEQSNQSEEAIRVAESYETFLKITNTGKDIAHDCCVQIKNIEYSSTGENFTSIESNRNEYLQWNGANTKLTPIHPNQDGTISVVKLKKDETATTPGNAQSPPLILTVGTSIVNKEVKLGHWRITLLCTCKNCPAIDYVMDVYWDGKWSQRLPELLGYSINSVTPKGGEKEKKNKKGK